MWSQLVSLWIIIYCGGKSTIKIKQIKAEKNQAEDPNLYVIINNKDIWIWDIF